MLCKCKVGFLAPLMAKPPEVELLESCDVRVVVVVVGVVVGVVHNFLNRY